MVSEYYVLGVNGSPYPDGIVAQLLGLVLQGAEEAGAETETIHLYQLRIDPTPGFYSKDPALETVENMPDDDMKPLYAKVLRACGIVFATPTYWSSMSAEMKKFIERLTPLENQGYQLTGKIGAFIAASKENHGGTEMAAMSMLISMMEMGFMVPPFSVLWYPSNVDNEPDWALRDAPHIGRNMVRLANRIRGMNWPHGGGE